jgi:hypothetical protein
VSPPRDGRGNSGSWADLVRPYRPCPLPRFEEPELAATTRRERDQASDPTRRAEPGDGAGRARAETSARGGRRGLVLTPRDDPRRSSPKVLGRANAGPTRGLVVLDPADARYHMHGIGRTGVGKSTFLANLVIGEAEAGRGVLLIDCQGDLSRHVLDRLPVDCADRLVILDPDEQQAPPAYNPLAPDRDDPTGQAAEWAAEHVAGVFRALYSSSWGARMEDYLRGACLTLARRPGSTVPDIVTLLTDAQFRARVLDEYGTPEGLGTLWTDLDAMTPNGRASLLAPLITRLRGVLSRRFARQLLAPSASTFRLDDILDGGVFIGRIPKGEIGAETSRLISGLLVAAAWGATTRRSSRAPHERPDATIVLDEAQNVLALPVDIDLALAESRGYRVGWVLAHQHCDQLPPKVDSALAANARNKIIFSVEPGDARKLARFFTPWLTEHDLSARPAYEAAARTVAGGHDQPPYTLDTLDLPEPVPGRAEWLRARARARTGLPRTPGTGRGEPRPDHPTERPPSGSGPGSGEPGRRSRLEADPPHDPGRAA